MKRSWRRERLTFHVLYEVINLLWETEEGWPYSHHLKKKKYISEKVKISMAERKAEEIWRENFAATMRLAKLRHARWRQLKLKRKLKTRAKAAGLAAGVKPKASARCSCSGVCSKAKHKALPLACYWNRSIHISLSHMAIENITRKHRRDSAEETSLCSAESDCNVSLTRKLAGGAASEETKMAENGWKHLWRGGVAKKAKQSAKAAASMKKCISMLSKASENISSRRKWNMTYLNEISSSAISHFG